MVKALAASLILFATATAHAQQTQARQDLPLLIRNTVAHPDDSPLVRAARAAVAARLRSTNRQVIDDRTVRRGRVFQSTGPVNVSFPLPFDPPAPPTRPAAPSQQLIDAQKRVDSLRQEQQRMAEEADQGPYGEVDEDRVEQRMTEIPREIEKAQRDVQTATPPPPQP